MNTLNKQYFPSHLRLALRDMKEGLLHWRIWLLLSWQDIRLRYRRSQLGPFWLTISMAITTFSMGILYGHLFKLEIKRYFPHLVAGMITWQLVALLIVDSTSTFIDAENFLKQIKLSYSVFILRVICRSLIVFLHNIVVIIPLFFIFHLPISFHLFMFIPSLFLLSLNAFFFGLILAILGARYRDLAQLIASIIQVIFFLTPIMWDPVTLPTQYQHWVWWNPFAHLIEILRAPLLGSLPTTQSLIFVCTLTVIGASCAVYLLTKVRDRIIYWL